jgi:hypothetical protein
MDPETGAAAWKISGGANGSHISNYSALLMIFAVGVSAIGILMLAAGALFTPLLAAILISVGLHILLLEGIFNPDHAKWADVEDSVKRIAQILVAGLGVVAGGALAVVLYSLGILLEFW